MTRGDISPLGVVLCVGGRGQRGVRRRGRGVTTPGVRVGVGDHGVSVLCVPGIDLTPTALCGSSLSSCLCVVSVIMRCQCPGGDHCWWHSRLSSGVQRLTETTRRLGAGRAELRAQWPGPDYHLYTESNHGLFPHFHWDTDALFMCLKTVYWAVGEVIHCWCCSDLRPRGRVGQPLGKHLSQALVRPESEDGTITVTGWLAEWSLF